MLTRNAQSFRSFTQSNEVNGEFLEGDNGESLVQFRQSIKGGPVMNLMVIFDSEDSLVSIYGENFVTGINPSKKVYLYELLNNLNAKYTYFKFVLSNDAIEIQAFDVIDNNYSNDTIMRILLGIIQVAEREYPIIMKTIWS